jgi:hypothetical protein
MGPIGCLETSVTTSLHYVTSQKGEGLIYHVHEVSVSSTSCKYQIQGVWEISFEHKMMMKSNAIQSSVDIVIVL